MPAGQGSSLSISSSSTSSLSSSWSRRNVFRSIVGLLLATAVLMNEPGGVMAQDTPFTPTLPFTSWTVYQERTFASDSDGRLMRLEPNEREWIQIPGTGNSTAIFGSRFAYVGSNGNLIMHNFPVDNNTSGDTFPAGTLSIRKLSGSTSELWLTSKGGDLFRFIYAQTQYLVDGTHKVVDLAISNRVYIINEEGHVCSRSFTEMDWVCTSNIPEGVKFSLITASASMIYVMAENGTVYATSIPLVAGIGFYPTGYTIPGGSSWLSFPADGTNTSNPFAIRGDNGTIDNTFCSAPSVNCFRAPASITPTITTTTTTAVPTVTTTTTVPANPESGGMSTGLLVGIIAGGGVLIIAIIIIATFVAIRRRQSSDPNPKPPSPLPLNPLTQFPPNQGFRGGHITPPNSPYGKPQVIQPPNSSLKQPTQVPITATAVVPYPQQQQQQQQPHSEKHPFPVAPQRIASSAPPYPADSIPSPHYPTSSTLQSPNYPTASSASTYNASGSSSSPRPIAPASPTPVSMYRSEKGYNPDRSQGGYSDNRSQGGYDTRARGYSTDSRTPPATFDHSRSQPYDHHRTAPATYDHNRSQRYSPDPRAQGLFAPSPVAGGAAPMPEEDEAPPLYRETTILHESRPAWQQRDAKSGGFR